MTLKTAWRLLVTALIILVGRLLAMPPRSFSARQEIAQYDFSLLDSSWQRDLPSACEGPVGGGGFHVHPWPALPGDTCTRALGRPGQAVPDSVITMSAVWLLLATTGAATNLSSR